MKKNIYLIVRSLKSLPVVKYILQLQKFMSAGLMCFLNSAHEAEFFNKIINKFQDQMAFKIPLCAGAATKRYLVNPPKMNAMLLAIPLL